MQEKSWWFSNSIYPSLYRDLRVQVISLRPFKRRSWVVSVLKGSSTYCSNKAECDSSSTLKTWAGKQKGQKPGPCGRTTEKGPIYKDWRKGRSEEAEVTFMICAETLGKLHLAAECQEGMRRLTALIDRKFLLQLQRQVQPVLLWAFLPQHSSTDAGRETGRRWR